MGIKELFSSILTILFRYRKFWRELKADGRTEELDLQREYAVPVIALVQLMKFPLIGVPRTAMFFAIANFLVDVAALYLVTGGAAALLARSGAKNTQAKVLTIFCYSMTPVWLFELFYFTGSWSWLFAAFALSYTLVISRNGLSVLFALDEALCAAAMRNVALFLVLVNGAAFLVIKALMRLFNF